MRKFNNLVMICSFVLLSVGCVKNDDDKSGNSDNDLTIKNFSMLYRNTKNDTSNDELWMYKSKDGSNNKIPIVLPSGWQLVDEDMAEVTSDGKQIVFLAYTTDAVTEKEKVRIYTSQIDGSSMKLIKEYNTWLGIQALVNNNLILFWKDNEDGLWTMGIDGQNEKKLPISLSQNWTFGDEELAKVSSDGKTIYFLASNEIEQKNAIYQCAIDGSSLKSINISSVVDQESWALQDIIKDSAILYRSSIIMNGSDNNKLYTTDIKTGFSTSSIVNLVNQYEIQNEECAKAIPHSNIMIFIGLSGSSKNLYQYNPSTKEITDLETLSNASGDIAIQSIFVE